MKIRFCAFQYAYIGGGSDLCSFDEYLYITELLACSAIGWLYYSLVFLIIGNGLWQMVSERKFLHIDRNPTVSYRPTVKDAIGESGIGSVHGFCNYPTVEKNAHSGDSCGTRQAF